MAIYHASCKPVGRRAGRSSVAAAAYRAGCELIDERTGEVHDYGRKSGVVLAQVIAPNGLNLGRSELWNAAEAREKRKDGRTAREWVVALPHELGEAQRIEVAREFAGWLVARYQVAADMAVHQPARGGDDRNHHAHILLTTRKVNESGTLTEKSDIELDGAQLKRRGVTSSKNQIVECRQAWERIVNFALEQAGHLVRIDHRSHDDAELAVMPTTKLGPTATDMERKGRRSARGEINRALAEKNKSIRAANDELKSLRIVEARGKVIKNELFELERNIDKKPKKWTTPLLEAARSALLRAATAYECLINWRGLEKKFLSSNGELQITKNKMNALGEIDQLAEEKLEAAEFEMSYANMLAHEEWINKNEADKLKIIKIKVELEKINSFDCGYTEEKENDQIIDKKEVGDKKDNTKNWRPLRRAHGGSGATPASKSRPSASFNLRL